MQPKKRSRKQMRAMRKAEMNILQIGAGRGRNQVLDVCRRCKEHLNKVVLVEPQPKAMEAVRRAYRDVPNCEFVEAAVTDRPEDTAQLWLPGSADDAPFALASLRAENIALRGRKVEACLEVPALRITELQAMFEATIAPRLAAASEVARGVLWVMGRPEALVAEQLEALPEAAAVRLAWYAHHGEIEVRVEADREQDSEAFLAAARDLLGEDRYEPAEGERLQHVVVRALAARGWKVATAESITGGLVAERLTSVPGASTVLDVSWVTYAPAAKTRELGVPADLIEREGVVSQAVAEAMAAGALERARADVAVATTGVAGPDTLPGPDGLPVPVGRVHVALAARDGRRAHRRLDLPLVRDLVRHHAALAALDLLRRAARVG